MGGEVARHLCHERRVRMGCDAGDVNGASGVVDDEQDVVGDEAVLCENSTALQMHELGRCAPPDR